MSDQPVLPYVLEQPIVTERLRLRVMTLDDVDDIHSYQSLEEVVRYDLFDPRTREEVAAKVEKYSKATAIRAQDDFFQFAIELPAEGEARSRVIGDLYFTLASLKNSRGEIGWTLHPDFQGRGYATEAATAVLDLAFRVIGLHRVFADLDPRNAASIALCRRLGMREEAHFVKDLWFKGDWGDTGIYAILRDEWLAAHS
jgi:RimJ/RimL family protein N-acetyltransferase